MQDELDAAAGHCGQQLKHSFGPYPSMRQPVDEANQRRLGDDFQAEFDNAALQASCLLLRAV